MKKIKKKYASKPAVRQSVTLARLVRYLSPILLAGLARPAHFMSSLRYGRAGRATCLATPSQTCLFKVR